MLDEVAPLGKTMQSAQPYRRQIVGLPLQRSLFGLAAHAASTLGLPGLDSEQNFPARLDENGDLFLDRSQVAALTNFLPSFFTPETLERMRATQAAACDSLVRRSEDAARLAASCTNDIRQVTDELASAMALVLAYGVLSKFLPDVLLRALADAGDTEPPPFPGRSAGAALMQESFALNEACCGLGYTPERLRDDWPNVPPEVSQLLGAFCQRQTGFGPLAWDSPGYEDPNYVVRLLHSAFNQVDPEQVGRRFSSAKQTAVTRPDRDVPPMIAALRLVLAFWLEFLERETWYIRRAFYIGMIPLLRQLAAEHHQRIPGFQATDLLFFEVQEVTAGPADPAVVRARRDRYMANAEYLSLHGIAPNRLASILGSS